MNLSFVWTIFFNIKFFCLPLLQDMFQIVVNYKISRHFPIRKVYTGVSLWVEMLIVWESYHLFRL
jgi:hypothetical protein